MQTGNYYLLEVYSDWSAASKFIILDYLTSSASNWETNLAKLTSPTMYHIEDLSSISIYDLVEKYSNQNNRFKFQQFWPLTSTTSLADDYPELFIQLQGTP